MLSLVLMLSIFLLITSIDSQLSFSSLRQMSNALESSELLTFEFDADSMIEAQCVVSLVTCDDIVRNCSEFNSVNSVSSSSFSRCNDGGGVSLALVDLPAFVTFDRTVCSRSVFVWIDFIRASTDDCESVDLLLLVSLQLLLALETFGVILLLVDFRVTEVLCFDSD